MTIEKTIQEQRERSTLILHKFLKDLVTKNASDLHLKVMRPPMIRLDGKLIPLDYPVLKPDDIKSIALCILPRDSRDKFREKKAIDIGYSVPGLARFRTHIFQQRSSFGIVFRNIPHEIRSITDLDLPEQLIDLVSRKQGLILVTGPTGSGKSTTLAAMLKQINSTRNVHIVTIEDPIEFLFRDKLACISQREVGFDTPTFAEALRNVLRQDPDVIMVGEMRDQETMMTVLTAAETGHLVLSTLHTNDSPQTIDRIIDMFPSSQQQQIRLQLSHVLLAVISQHLVKKKNVDGMVAAVEILIASPNAKKLILTGNTGELVDEIESSVVHTRMQSMNQSLMALILNNVISKEEAVRCSANASELELNLTKLFADKLKDSDDHDQKGGKSDLSKADFSKIMKLIELEKDFQEQMEKHNKDLDDKDSVIQEKDNIIKELERELLELRKELQKANQKNSALLEKSLKMQKEKEEEISKLSRAINDMTPKSSEKDKKGFGIFKK